MNFVPSLRNCVNGILKTELFQEVYVSYTCIDYSKHTGKKSVSGCSSWSAKFLDHRLCVTGVTQEGGGVANAENITLHQKFRRGMCRGVVQEQYNFTVFFQSSLPAISSCCRYKVVMEPDRKYFSGYLCFLICVTMQR